MKPLGFRLPHSKSFGWDPRARFWSQGTGHLIASAPPPKIPDEILLFVAISILLENYEPKPDSQRLFLQESKPSRSSVEASSRYRRAMERLQWPWLFRHT